MAKAIIDCEVCNKLSSVETEDLHKVTCPKCGNKDIFFRDIEF